MIEKIRPSEMYVDTDTGFLHIRTDDDGLVVFVAPENLSFENGGKLIDYPGLKDEVDKSTTRMAGYLDAKGGGR